MGKTTIATKFPKSLLLAFEKGYSAIPGVMAQPMNKWTEFKSVLTALKDPSMKQMFETIIIDTADIAYDYCCKYISQQNNVDIIADIGYGKGYGLAENEFDTCLRTIVQLDYGLVLISHAEDKTFKDEQGVEYNRIVPTLDKRARNIVARMTDIIGYSRAITETLENNEQKTTTKLFIRGTTRYLAGSRFKYTPDYIDFTYDNLVNAIRDAIDKQMEEDGAEYFTDNKNNLFEDTTKELDFDDLMEQFNSIVNKLISENDETKFKEYWQPRVVQITDKYLGRGQKVSQCSREQVEALSLIVDDLKELINK